jgi:soluble lytic murein transglycosylase-like protein
MRRLLARAHIPAWSAGLALVALAALTAIQPALQSRTPHVDAFSVARHGAPASASSTPGSFRMPMATAAVPSPLPVLMLRVPLEPASPSPSATPAPRHTVAAPAPPRVAYSGAQIVAIITAAAQAYGVDPSWLINTAACESGYNPYADNPSGPYEGLFQFLPSTFRAHGGTDIWDPTQQAQIAASMFAAGESGEWPVCSRR